MDTLSTISGIRAVRAFADRPLDPEHLRVILDAGRRAPSSKNSQRWAFIAVRDRGRLEALSAVGDYAGHVAKAAAAVALVAPNTSEPDRWALRMFDLGQVAQNMMLAAWELGVGSAHASVYRDDLSRQILGYPSNHRCPLLISLGYPADAEAMSTPPRPGGRRRLGDVVHQEQWDDAP